MTPWVARAIAFCVEETAGVAQGLPLTAYRALRAVFRGRGVCSGVSTTPWLGEEVKSLGLIEFALPLLPPITGSPLTPSLAAVLSYSCPKAQSAKPSLFVCVYVGRGVPPLSNDCP